MLLLPVDAIMTVLDMGRSALKTKVLAGLLKIMDKCGCSENEGKKETPKE